MSPRSALLLLTCVVAGACASDAPVTTGVGDRNQSFELGFTTTTVRPGDAPVPDVFVEGRTGEVFAIGAIGAEAPCFEVDGNVVLDDRDLTLTVTASPNEECTEQVDTVAYEALISALSAGTYRFDLVHLVPQSSPDTVVDRDVTVE